MAKRKGRQEVGEFNLSFLDVISCGFGAVILLLIITRTATPFTFETNAPQPAEVLQDLQAEQSDIRRTTTAISRQIAARRATLTGEVAALGRAQQELARLSQQLQPARSQSAEDTQAINQWGHARQSLTEEMQRLLGMDYRRDNQIIGGIPVDSEYVIFVIDTSGSMFTVAWPLVLAKVEEVLNVYPELKGIQVMNDMGDYMFSGFSGRWIPDTPARRKVIMRRLQTWNPFSNSSPVEGITRAIRDFWSPDRRISVYVFGDEFTGPSIQQVVAEVDRLNQADVDGSRRVRIHAVGFPVMFSRHAQTSATGIRFATLMRELTFRNGGTFVGLENTES